MKSHFKKLSYENKFSRNFACWCANHKGLSKMKKANRQESRIKLKRELDKEIDDIIDH